MHPHRDHDWLLISIMIRKFPVQNFRGRAMGLHQWVGVDIVS